MNHIDLSNFRFDHELQVHKIQKISGSKWKLQIDFLDERIVTWFNSEFLVLINFDIKVLISQFKLNSELQV